tara:strand:+ start:243 stop:3002 length:2760 start_codon:yes stop_codon:yes gene_type:complete
MPKITANLNSFEGGVNRNADPRDIADNESAILWGWNVSDKGVLKLGGGQAYTTVGPTTDITSVDVTDTMAGHGLGFFSADYNLAPALHDETANGVTLNFERTDYVFLADDASNIFIHPYSAETGEYSADDVQDFNLGGDSPGKIKYYSADGGMRIYDADFNNTANVNKSFLPVQYKYCRKAVEFIDDILLEDLGGAYDSDIIPPASAYQTNRWIFGDGFLDTSNNSGYKNFDPGQSTGDGTADTITQESYLALNSSMNIQNANAVINKSNLHENFNHNTHSLASEGTGLGNKVWVRMGINTDVSSDAALHKTFDLFVTYIYDEKQETTPIPVRDFINGGSPYFTGEAGYALRFMMGFAMIGKNAAKSSADQWHVSYTYADLKTWNPRITGICLYMSETSSETITSDRVLYLVHEIDLLSGTVRTPGRPVGEQKSNLIWSKSNSTFGTGFDNYITQLPGETYQSRIGYNAFGNFYEKFKTATVLNRRTYIGNVATLNPNGTIKRVYDDRMVKSPVNLFDTFPEENFVDVAINDGDEIIHLEGFSDRILQYKKRNLYIVNVSQDFEFLEGTYEGLGIRHHTQVCKTPQGVAWINKQGCHFYDGKKVVNLINNKIRIGKVITASLADIEYQLGDLTYFKTIFDDEGVITDGGEFNEYPGWTGFMTSEFEITSDGTNTQKNSMPSIGYDAQSNKLIIIKSLNRQGQNETTGWVYAYDMINASWTLHPYAYGPTGDEENKTNFIINSQRELVLYQNLKINNNEFADESSLYKWTDVNSQRVFINSVPNLRSPHKIFYKSKDIDFGQPSIRKKIYKIYITYRSNQDTSIKPTYAVNGNTLELDTFGYRANGSFLFTSDSLIGQYGLKNTNNIWEKAELKPANSLEANNIYSFQLIIRNVSPNTTINNLKFAINDISIVYRNKGIR